MLLSHAADAIVVDAIIVDAIIVDAIIVDASMALAREAASYQPCKECCMMARAEQARWKRVLKEPS